MSSQSALEYFVSFVRVLDWFILCFLVVYCVHYLFQLVTAWFELRTVFREEKQADSWCC